MARRHPVCKGFAVGRTIFAKPAEDWLAGRIDDEQAIQAMAAAYRRLIDAWEGRAMSELLLRNRAPDASGLVHRVTPESAGWGHVGFELWRLRPGQSLAQATGEREACLVLVGGRADIEAGGQSWAGPRRARRPVRGHEPVLGLRALARGVPGHRDQRARARGLHRTRRRGATRRG